MWSVGLWSPHVSGFNSSKSIYSRFWLNFSNFSWMSEAVLHCWRSEVVSYSCLFDWNSLAFSDGFAFFVRDLMENICSDNILSCLFGLIVLSFWVEYVLLNITTTAYFACRCWRRSFELVYFWLKFLYVSSDSSISMWGVSHISMINRSFMIYFIISLRVEVVIGSVCLVEGSFEISDVLWLRMLSFIQFILLFSMIIFDRLHKFLNNRSL